MWHKGQSLTEYSLTLCSIVMVCIVALMSLASNINTILFGMVPTASSSQVAYALPIPNLPGSMSVNQNVSLQNGIPTMGQSIAQPLTESTALLPQKTKSTIQVSGANGTTRQLADLLMVKAQQLLDTGTAPPAQVQTLIALANQGFVLADAQKLLEDAISNNQKEVIYNGKAYSLTQFAAMFGINPPSGTQWDLSPQYGAQLMKPFMEQYQAVLESGLLNTPDIEKTVSSLSYQIVSIGDALTWSLNELTSGGQGTPSLEALNSKLAETFQADMEGAVIGYSASSATQKNSTGICNAGSGSSNGVTCSQ